MLIILILLAVLFSIVGIILGVAWWSNLKERKSARGWAIAASLLNLLILIAPPLFYYFEKGWDAFCQTERVFGIPTIIGISVLVVVLRQNSIRVGEWRRSDQ